MKVPQNGFEVIESHRYPKPNVLPLDQHVPFFSFRLMYLDRPCVAQWLERPLGVREAGVRSPTASPQRRKKMGGLRILAWRSALMS